MPLMDPSTPLALGARLAALRGRFTRRALEVTRPQGPIALAGATLVHVRASGAGVLDIGVRDGARARYRVVDGCDCDLVVDAAPGARITARYRGLVVDVDAVVVAAPVVDVVDVVVPAVAVVVPAVTVDVVVPAFALPQPVETDRP